MQLKILLLAFVLSLFIFPAFSQTTPLISVSVSNDIYEEGETVVISGKVATIIVDTPVNIQIFNKGNLIEIAQLDVAQDGTFTHTVIAEGPQWGIAGEYIVRASYGEGKIAETTFEFFKKEIISDTTNIFEVDAGSHGTFDVEYTIRGGTVKDMIVDSEIFALIVIVDSTSDGSITLDLPRFAIDALKIDGTDDRWIILIDGIEVDFEETKTSDSRVVTIQFEEGDSDIEVIGTKIIPEFGVIVSLVLAISMVLLIIISKKTLTGQHFLNNL